MMASLYQSGSPSPARVTALAWRERPFVRVFIGSSRSRARWPASRKAGNQECPRFIRSAKDPDGPLGLGKSQLRQRCECIPSTDVWNDAQLEHRNRREFDVMIFRL